MGEGRSSGSREMRGGRESGGGGGTSEHVNKLNILPGSCLWCNNFHFVLCGLLASWDNVLFFYCIIFSFVTII